MSEFSLEGRKHFVSTFIPEMKDAWKKHVSRYENSSCIYKTQNTATETMQRGGGSDSDRSAY